MMQDKDGNVVEEPPITVSLNLDSDEAKVGWGLSAAQGKSRQSMKMILYSIEIL